MALTDIIVATLATAVDRTGIPKAMKTLRDETETRLAALEALSADTKPSVRGCPTSALAAYTRTDNTILADAVGALGAQDGVTYTAGQSLLLRVGAAGADNGIWDVVSAGDGSTKYQLTRRADSDSSAEMTSGHRVYVEEGTLNGGEVFFCSTSGTITLNTTALTYTQEASLQDLASTGAGLGASLIGINDAGDIITGTTVEAALQENRTAIDTAEAAIVVNAADLDAHRPGVPMQNRLRLLGAPGPAVAGDTVTIGGDVYEFNANTPPSGGTAGRIWVYNGASSAVSRANLINAINNVTDAPNITYDGAVTEAMYAFAGITTGDIIVVSATAIGSTTAAPSATATATTETLTTVTDIWDEATMRSGDLQAANALQIGYGRILAEHIVKGTFEMTFSFTPTRAVVINHQRPQDEAWAISGNSVSLTLAGGGAPNNQANDYVSVIAMA